jgi:Sec-independent protein translocase protein TatA
VDIGLLLLIILIVVFVWRGPKTLPELGKMFGEGVRTVRRQMRSDADDTPDHSSGQPGSGGR